MKTKKKALLVGLGVLTGVVSIAQWLFKNSFQLTITDLKTEKDLAESIKI